MSKSRYKRSKKGERFLKIPSWIMECKAWTRLTPVQRNVWVEALRLYDGTNNGFLALASRRLGERVGVEHVTIARALRNLQTFGFLEITSASSFSRKRLAAEYRLTHLKCDRTQKPPSNQFMHLGKQPTESSIPIV